MVTIRAEKGEKMEFSDVFAGSHLADKIVEDQIFCVLDQYSYLLGFPPELLVKQLNSGIQFGNRFPVVLTFWMYRFPLFL